MIYCGGGIISARPPRSCIEFVERTGIPVASTLMARLFPETHELSAQVAGHARHVYANNAVNEADLLLAIGRAFR